MTEKEKQQKGMLYQANDPEVLKDLYYCENECFEINQIPPSRREERMERLRRLFGKAGDGMFIVAPFFCDYGYNIEVGENFFANTNCVILDEAKVTFGDNVFLHPIAPSILLVIHLMLNSAIRRLSMHYLFMLGIMCG